MISSFITILYLTPYFPLKGIVLDFLVEGFTMCVFPTYSHK
jgi:hypothetical protein